MASARFVAVVVLAAVAVASAASAPAFGANETPLSQVLPARGLTLRLNGDALVAGKSASLTWAATLSPLLSAMGRPRVTAEARELAWVEAGDRTDVTGAFCEAVLRWNGDLSSWTVLQANVSSIMIEELMAKPARVATNADKNAVSASFMSFNIRNGMANDGDNSWPYRTDLVYAVIEDHEPGFIGLQEAYLFQLEDMLENSRGYFYIGVGRDDGMEAGEYSPIMYKSDLYYPIESGTFWYCDSPYEPGCTSYGNSIPRVCTWGIFIDRASGELFYYLNMHMDHSSQESREKSVAQLLDFVDSRRGDGLPFVLTGDFNNNSENSTEIIALREYGFADTFRVLYPDAVDVGTFNSFVGTTTGAKIDFVWVSQWTEVEVTQASIIHDNDNGRYPSDHFPVDATITL